MKSLILSNIGMTRLTQTRLSVRSVLRTFAAFIHILYYCIVIFTQYGYAKNKQTIVT